jgi:hypothetical protein
MYPTSILYLIKEDGGWYYPVSLNL